MAVGEKRNKLAYGENEGTSGRRMGKIEEQVAGLWGK